MNKKKGLHDQRFGSKPDFFRPFFTLCVESLRLQRRRWTSAPDTVAFFAESSPESLPGRRSAPTRITKALSGLAASSSAVQVELRCRCQSLPLLPSRSDCITPAPVTLGAARRTEAYLMRRFLPCLPLGLRLKLLDIVS